MLSPRAPVPVDRESANPLAEVIFPTELPVLPPILAADTQAAVNALVAEWRGAEKLEQGGFPPARTCLIYGLPGTGKTQLALWLAAQIGLPVVLARLDGLISSLLGTTSRNIAALFNFASRYSCVLLLDEFDAIAKLRDDPQEVGEIKRVVNTLLQNLDARREIGITIGVTNHEHLLDRAIWRRFEVQLGVGLPGPEARVAIARAYFGPTAAMDDALLRVLAWLTEGASGAEIEILVTSIRKRLLLAGEETSTAPLSLVRDVMAMHGGRIGRSQHELLNGPDAMVARILTENVGLNQQEAAALQRVDRTTVSRWVRRRDVATPLHESEQGASATANRHVAPSSKAAPRSRGRKPEHAAVAPTQANTSEPAQESETQ